jgi:hypothetical protein
MEVADLQGRYGIGSRNNSVVVAEQALRSQSKKHE